MIEEHQKTKEYQLNIILDKMCTYVGLNREDVNWKDNYFLKHSWTEEQEEDFRQWLIEELRSKYMMFALTGYSSQVFKSKKMRTKVANEFVNWYGWTLQNKELVSDETLGEKVNIKQNPPDNN